MAYPDTDAPNLTIRSSDTAIWVREDCPVSTALMDRALGALPSLHHGVVAQIYFDDKDTSIALAIRSGESDIGKLIATEFEQALCQAGAPGHGGIYVWAGAISDGLPLATLEANVWAPPDEPMVQAG